MEIITQTGFDKLVAKNDAIRRARIKQEAEQKVLGRQQREEWEARERQRKKEQEALARASRPQREAVAHTERSRLLIAAYLRNNLSEVSEEEILAVAEKENPRLLKKAERYRLQEVYSWGALLSALVILAVVPPIFVFFYDGLSSALVYCIMVDSFLLMGMAGALHKLLPALQFYRTGVQS